MNEAEAIVRLLAAQDCDNNGETGCRFCAAGSGHVIAHRGDCAWSRARAWVEANPKEKDGA